MNKDLSALYVAILNNEVVCFETNLANFVTLYQKLEPKGAAYITFYRKFKASDRFAQTIGDKEYHFQKVI